jgi:CheY-like chemotaxis protein
MNRGPLQHILYVEDDADIRTVAQLALEAVGGYTLKTCASGQEAMEAVAGGYRPDLILLDVMMPGLDGPGTLSGLRRLPLTMATVPPRTTMHCHCSCIRSPDRRAPSAFQNSVSAQRTLRSR